MHEYHIEKYIDDFLLNSNRFTYFIKVLVRFVITGKLSSHNSKFSSLYSLVMSMCGGLTSPSQPTDDDLKILMPVFEKYLEEQCGQKPSEIKIVEVSRQIVAGVNYFAKVSNLIQK